MKEKLLRAYELLGTLSVCGRAVDVMFQIRILLMEAIRESTDQEENGIGGTSNDKEEGRSGGPEREAIRCEAAATGE